MFFSQDRPQFFRPLTSKYREQIVECLKELHSRLYSASNADYGQAMQKDTLIEIFQEALVRAPEVRSQDDSNDQTENQDELSPDSDQRFKSERELASWILKILLEYGWLEKQVDEATLTSTYQFTRYGRTFTEPFVDSARASSRTRHRNTRNTRNALQSFNRTEEVYDLLDAFEYSERIIADFTDIIAELDERKRELVKEMEAQLLVKKASDQFFDFMEKRFQPDLAIRLSADSVEKYRDIIADIIKSIKQWPKDKKANAERKLRDLVPEFIEEGKSVLYYLLDGIEQRLRNASDIMLPALRKSLQNFTKRADIIIRQMSYLASQQHNDLLSVCKKIADQPKEQQDLHLDRVADLMSVPQLGFLDPQSVRIHAARKQRMIDTSMDETEDFDEVARKEIYVQQILDQAFFINSQGIKDYLIKHLVEGKAVSTRDLPIDNAIDFLAVSHAVSVAAPSNLSSEFEFSITPSDQVITNETYFKQRDEFIIELVKKEEAESHHA